MKKILPYLLMGLAWSPFSLYAKYNYEETVHLPLHSSHSDKWRVNHKKITKDGTAITHYYFKGESKEKWTKMINIQFKDKSHLKGTTAEGWIKNEAELSSKEVKSTTIESEEGNYLYERAFPSGESELVRIMVTEKGLHRVSYVKKGKFSEEERKEWKERLLKAEVGGQKTEKKDKAKKSSKAKPEKVKAKAKSK